MTMSKARTSPALLVTLLAVFGFAACAGGASQADGGVHSNGGGTVISGAALLDGQGSVLETLRGKVPNLKIQRYVGECPRITFRNDASYQTAAVTPHVYVDGTRATDTCILESLQGRNVQRVEVYPSGVSGRPGYPSHAHGLILVFLRS